jgi:hypothetical protein
MTLQRKGFTKTELAAMTVEANLALEDYYKGKMDGKIGGIDRQQVASKLHRAATAGQTQAIIRDEKQLANIFQMELDGVTLDLLEEELPQGSAPPLEPLLPSSAEPRFSKEDFATAAGIKKMINAPDFLDEAAATMKARAALRDKPTGERTAKKIAEVFNAITGHEITEADAWIFLIALKIVRSRSGKFNRDDYVDMAAYAGLLGEHESVSRE